MSHKDPFGLGGKGPSRQMCEITIHGCKDVPKMDTFGWADPYVILSKTSDYSTSVYCKTEVKKGEKNPVWDYTTMINLMDNQTKICATVLDSDLTSDDVIGMCEIQCLEACQRLELSLKGEEAKNCKLVVSVEYYPPSQKYILDPKTKTIKKSPFFDASRTSMLNYQTALPLITTLDEHQLCNPGQLVAGLADSNLPHRQRLQEGAAVFIKYEIPIGLIQRLDALSTFHRLEFIVDDSSSMTQATNALDPSTKKPYPNRWMEVKHRMKMMLEVMATIPVLPEIQIRFLCRKDLISLPRKDQNTNIETYIERVDGALMGHWEEKPSGSTPVLAVLKQSFNAQEPGTFVKRYFFGDGTPDGGKEEERSITSYLQTRPDPVQSPFTFFSCSNNEEEVAWMKKVEETAPYCAEYDDFDDEAKEICKDQGNKFPISFGLYLVCCCVGACFPDDLDAMDEGVPLTKTSLDNILGYTTKEKDYNDYFSTFIESQKSIAARMEGAPSTTSVGKFLKTQLAIWEKMRGSFAETLQPANDFPEVALYRQMLRHRSERIVGGDTGKCVVNPFAPTSVLSGALALPILTSLEDHKRYMPKAPLAGPFADPEKSVQISAKIAANRDVFLKYEIPMGLVSRLDILTTFQLIDVIVDDSGSMWAWTDMLNPETEQKMKRWDEVFWRFLQMLEVMSTVITPPIEIHFLNRRHTVHLNRETSETPPQFVAKCRAILEKEWKNEESGGTPVMAPLRRSFAKHPQERVMRFFFGDGVPNEPVNDVVRLVTERKAPENNPFTFFSCTNQDSDTEWMKECEEKAKFCSESDDFVDEAEEMRNDQGDVLPYSKGLYLICCCVGACYPEDLDALDEGVPLTKSAIDLLLGYETTEEQYKNYFKSMLSNVLLTNTGSDREAVLRRDFAKKFQLHEELFSTLPTASEIQIVKDFRKAMSGH